MQVLGNIRYNASLPYNVLFHKTNMLVKDLKMSAPKMSALVFVALIFYNFTIAFLV